ncbi:hypothetical protein LTR37_002397 [Vermiconidia calcicola]|uniref:Uncharacterized protein n=1 Tax=Vermiconidia calcicola TaxID=1690605 RepID=A0ACC3NTX6_9PEZI|nr:hypothetical protein LTR37_002397 [Vermiconidia calcicola]
MNALQENRFDTTRGMHYRYYVSSIGDYTPPKYTLLLCHGFPDDARLWQFVVPSLLKSGLRIVVPDLLGYGGTSKPTDPKEYNWELMVTDMVEVLEVEGILGGVIPMGHDWGAAFAQRFYMLQTDRCAGLINLCVALMEPFADNFDVDAVNDYTEKAIGYPVYAYWKLFLPEDGAKLMENRLESVWYVMHGDQEDWMKEMFCVHGAMREFIEADRKDVPLKPFAQDEKLKNEWIQSRKESGMIGPTNWYRALAYNHQLETEKKLNAKIEKPYLFIGADGDSVCRTDAIEGVKQKGLTPDLIVHEVHSGHWSPYEKPEEIAKIVVDWCSEKGFSKA